MKSLFAALSFLTGLVSSARAADFTVSNPNDQGPGSLYQAITDANSNAGQDRIVFNIPGPGVHVIDVSNRALPKVTSPLIIDGYTQPGAHPNTLAVGDDAVILIQIDNTQHHTSVSTGLSISAGTSIVRGLSITGFSTSGIEFLGSGTANIVEGNFIGLAPDGITAMPNNIGIDVSTSGNRVGGTTPDARNVVAGQSSNLGIRIQREPNTVAGNYIGTNASGTYALAHRAGIQVEASLTGGVIIGGPEPGAGNLIAGTFAGIQLGYLTSFLGHIIESPASGVEITGNLIGVTSDGKTPFRTNPDGIYIQAGSNNSITGNVIAFNGDAGVLVAASNGLNNKILSNSIYGWGPGIELGGDGPHPNDPMDPDEGPNHRQNFPVITSTGFTGDTMVINGFLNSAPNTQFKIQFFTDGSDYLHPSQALVGATDVVTDNNGNTEFIVGVPISSLVGPINATATDPAGNTSEFFTRPSHLRNLSTRAEVQTGDAVLIGGFIPQGFSNAGSEIIVRALGPSLSSGGNALPGRLEDPTLEIYVGGRLIATNDNWQDDPVLGAELQNRGLAPANAFEAAAVIYPGTGGQYTAIVRGKNNSSGIGLVEFYDVTGTNLRPVNLSTRGLVQGGDNVMIGGSILADGYGDTHAVIRAIGPSLVSAGIANPLLDPLLELYDANGLLIAANDDWQESQEAEIALTGLAPTDSAEAAIFASLQPGAYTAIVRGKGTSSGLALIELYQLP